MPDIGSLYLSLKLKDSTKEQIGPMVTGVEKQTAPAFAAAGRSAAKAFGDPVQKAGSGVIAAIKQDAVNAAAAYASLGKAAAGAIASRFKRKGKGEETAPAQSGGGWEAADNAVGLLNQKLDITSAKLGEQERKLSSLTAEYKRLAAAGADQGQLDDLDSQITATQGRIVSLKQSIQSIAGQINAAIAGSGRAVEQHAKKGQSVVTRSAKAMGSAIRSAFRSGGNAAGNALKGINQQATGLAKSVKSAFKSAFLMAGLYAAFRGIRSLISTAASQNQQFSATLQAVKTNLTAAFVPIANVVMPYINMLMGGIANLSAKLTSVTAAMFGTTVSQSIAAAKKLQANTDAAKKAAATSGIDELNVISRDEDGNTVDASKAITASGKHVTDMMTGIARKVGPFLAGIAGEIATAAPGIISSAVTVISALLSGINAAFPDITAAGIRLLQSLLDGAQSLLPQVGPLAVHIVTLLLSSFLTYAPALLRMGVQLLRELLSGLTAQMPALVALAQSAIRTIVSALSDNLPSILTCGVTILLELASGISQMLPQLLVSAVDMILALVRGIIESLPMILEQGTAIILRLVQGISSAIPVLINAAIDIIMALVDFILEHPDQIISAGIQIVLSLVAGLAKASHDLVLGVGKLIGEIVAKIFETDWIAVGKKILSGIWSGIKGAAKSIGNIFGGLFGGGKSASGSVSVPKFASGGIISGPTLAMVGEYGGARSDPEVISPLSKLQSLMGSEQSVPDGGVLAQILALLQRIETYLSGGNLDELLVQIVSIRRWLDQYSPDVRLYANDREIARSADRGRKSLGVEIAR